MIFGGCVRDDKSHRHAIEKAALAKIVADIKDQLVSPGSHFISREQWRINATVVVGLHGFEFFRLIDDQTSIVMPRAGQPRIVSNTCVVSVLIWRLVIPLSLPIAARRS